jgi:hypothetical protein
VLVSFPVVFGQRRDAFSQLRTHIGRNGIADRLLVEPAHQIVLVQRTVAAQIDLANAAGQRRECLLDHPAVARSGRYIAVAELIGNDHVLLGPQSQHRLIAAIAVIGTLGRPFVAGDHRGVDVEGRRLHRPTALQVEDEFGIGLGQTQQRHRLGGDRRLALLQQRQILAMELRQKIARGLRCRQVVPKQHRQRLVLAELIEIRGPLTTRRPHRQQAFRHLRCTQPALAALQPDLPVNHRRRPGLTKRLDQSGNSRMPRDQPRFQLNSDLKSSRSANLVSPTPRG